MPTLEARAKVNLGLAALGAGPDNLVYRAAERYLERCRTLTGEARGVALHLVKRIPIAAGFGGGSSNAAAALRGLASLYPAPINLLELGAVLGSDVPFFVQDASAAWGSGRGEQLEPASLPPLALVLVNPGVPVSAGEAYGALERLDPPLARARLLAELARGAEPSYRNSLEPGVLRRYPAVGEVLAALRAEGLRGVLMSGSGSSCFGLARDAAGAERAARSLARPGWWVSAARTG